MSYKSFKFFISEGVKSFIKNGLLSAASVITVSLCLTLCGIYILFSMNLNYAAKQVETNYEMQIFVDENADDTKTKSIEGKLDNISNINTISYVSKQQALKQWMDDMKDNLEALEGLEEDNPLRNSYKVTLVDLQLSEQTVAEITAIDGVAYVKNNKDTIDKLVDITAKI
ncbi:MAG: hypothetical protein GX800_03115 [Clostridiaceae bacterium]|nr:hypothetical protein [Clostridiaceae bacterium]